MQFLLENRPFKRVKTSSKSHLSNGNLKKQAKWWRGSINSGDKENNSRNRNNMAQKTKSKHKNLTKLKINKNWASKSNRKSELKYIGDTKNIRGNKKIGNKRTPFAEIKHISLNKQHANTNKGQVYPKYNITHSKTNKYIRSLNTKNIEGYKQKSQ